MDLLKAIYGNVIYNFSHVQQIYISTFYISFHQFQHCIHFIIPIYKKQEKLIHDFILQT